MAKKKDLSPSDVKGLCDALTSYDAPAVRARAARFFWEGGRNVGWERYSDIIFPSLVQATRDEYAEVRKEVAGALGTRRLCELADTRVVDPLVSLLKDPKVEVRMKAAWAFANYVRDRRAVETLIALLNDDDVRGVALIALGPIGDARAVDPIIRLLSDEQQPALTEGIRAKGRRGIDQDWRPKGQSGGRRGCQTTRATAEDTERKIAAAGHRYVGVRDGLHALETVHGLYAIGSADRPALEPVATSIGHLLNLRGGLQEMRRVWHLLGNMPGATLDMHWDGIGDWRG